MRALTTRPDRLPPSSCCLATWPANADFRERFKAEIETLRKLNHPNIVQIFGFGEEDNQIFYAMEYVSGSSLEDANRAAAASFHGARSRSSALPWPGPCGTPTTAASSIATSSPATCC